jgi:1-acyl-sn-glycerol-3-phosphate acyltransferase
MRVWGLTLRGYGDSALYTFCRWLAVPLFGGVYRCRVRGTGNLPKEGPAIVITNHKANLDPVIIGMICERPLRYMAKKELFKNPMLRKVIVTMGAFPIDRGAGDREALTTSLAVLAKGDALLMFPEGHRQRDDAVHEFQPGAAMIALRSGAAVVPMAMRGTQWMMRDGRPGLPALRAMMGPPLRLDDLQGRNSKTYHEAARRMQQAVAELYAQL